MIIWQQGISWKAKIFVPGKKGSGCIGAELKNPNIQLGDGWKSSLGEGWYLDTVYRRVRKHLNMQNGVRATFGSHRGRPCRSHRLSLSDRRYRWQHDEEIYRCAFLLQC